MPEPESFGAEKFTSARGVERRFDVSGDSRRVVYTVYTWAST
jgi:hypothetical protein